MKLPGRNTDDSDVPPELKPYYEQNGWRMWLRRVVGVVLLLAIAAAMVWAAVWVFGAITGDNSTDSTNTSTSQDSEDTTTPPATDDTESDTDATPAEDNTDTSDTTDEDATANDADQTQDETTEEPTDQEVLPSTGG